MHVLIIRELFTVSCHCPSSWSLDNLVHIYILLLHNHSLSHSYYTYTVYIMNSCSRMYKVGHLSVCMYIFTLCNKYIYIYPIECLTRWKRACGKDKFSIAIILRQAYARRVLHFEPDNVFCIKIYFICIVIVWSTTEEN